MKTSTLSRALVLGAASVPALTAVSCDKMPERKPNVIFILMDDAGYGDFGCYGQTRIETPNIDSLAARGIRFTDMYSAAPLSSPARCGLLTGMHTGHAQIRANDEMTARGDVWNHEAMLRDSTLEGQAPLKAGTPTLGSVMRQGGYRTAMIGKWGVGGPATESTPNKMGFDEYFGCICQRQAHCYYPPFLWENDRRIYLDNELLPPGTPLDEGADPLDPHSYDKYTQQTYSPDIMYDRVLRFVNENRERPFFLMWTTPIPHSPMQAPDEMVQYYVEKFGDAQPDVNMPMEENPRVQAIAKKERWGIDKDGKLVSKNKVYQLRDGLFEAIIDRFYKDPTLVTYGEDVRDWGGAFAVYRGLTEALPYHRLFNSPISESAIVGSAVGYAMAGGRALVELMYCDFLGCAGDEVFNQMAKWQAMSADIIKMPVTLRVSIGSKYGAQHSQDWTSLTAHIPGLKIAFPATPYDAKGLMASALVGTDPVMFFESQRIYDVGEQFHEGGVPEGYYEIPLGKADVKRAGKDVTILTFGAVLYRALKAADELKEKYGMEAEIIDARTLVPFDYETVIESVKKTGRLVIVTDACERGSFASEVARQITEMAFDELDAPPVVVASRNWITPAHELEESFFPQPSWILDAIDAKIVPLPGHVRVTDQSIEKKLSNERRGV